MLFLSVGSSTPIWFLLSAERNNLCRLFSVSGNGLGRRQAVRHKVLILAFGGSNPPAPAIFMRVAGYAQ